MAGPAILKIDIVSDSKGKGFNQADKDLATLARTANIAALAIGGALVAGSIKAVAAAEKGATANARLAQVLSQTAGASDDVVAAVQDQAKELARLTGIDDDVIKGGQGILGTFQSVAQSAGEVGGVFDRATTAAADLAAAGFGSVESNATALGKALEDPLKGLNALTRSGVTFTAAEQDKIKALVESGQVLEAQGIILAAIEGQVGGTAEATANSSDKMKESWDEAWESLGTLLLPALDALAEKVAVASEWVQGHTKLVGGIAVALGTFAATVLAVNAALRVYRTVIAAVRIATMLWTTAQVLLSIAMSANPIGVIVMGIAALIAIIGALIYWIAKNTTWFQTLWEWVKKVADVVRGGLAEAFDIVKGKVQGLIQWVRDLIGWLKDAWDTGHVHHQQDPLHRGQHHRRRSLRGPRHLGRGRRDGRLHGRPAGHDQHHHRHRRPRRHRQGDPAGAGPRRSQGRVGGMTAPRAVLLIDGADLSCWTLAEARATAGRETIDEQPEAGTLSARLIMASVHGAGRSVAVGAQAELWAATGGGEPDWRLFAGRITDVGAMQSGDGRWDLNVTAAGPMAELARTTIGDAPWPVETDSARIHRILGLAGYDASGVDPAAHGPKVMARDVDRQPALRLLHEAAQSGGGLLWEDHRDGIIRYQPRIGRGGGTGTWDGLGGTWDGQVQSWSQAGAAAPPAHRRRLRGALHAVALGIQRRAARHLLPGEVRQRQDRGGGQHRAPRVRAGPDHRAGQQRRRAGPRRRHRSHQDGAPLARPHRRPARQPAGAVHLGGPARHARRRIPAHRAHPRRLPAGDPGRLPGGLDPPVGGGPRRRPAMVHRAGRVRPGADRGPHPVGHLRAADLGHGRPRGHLEHAAPDRCGGIGGKPAWRN